MKLDAMGSLIEYVRLPSMARAERRLDARGPGLVDPGPEAAVAAHLEWLALAQDESTTADGGAARHFSLLDGWGASYPETTGYIVPTLLECGRRFGNAGIEARAARMLDWLVSIQLPNGAFQGGMVNEAPVVPVTFNTGQILLGLAAGAEHFEARAYVYAMTAAADWLTRTQDPDGAWRSAPSPFARPGEKSYDTHVAWGLLEAARVAGNERWAAAAFANIDWALTFQRPNGWFASCCLNDPARPLTHTIGYVLRGVLEGHLRGGDPNYLAAVRKAADALVAVQREDGALPGRLDENWSPAADWTCLTGNLQISAVWMALARISGEAGYLAAARQANRMVRRTLRLDAPPGIAGGVKGSFPVDGDYGRFQLLNWAVKFAIDANLVEMDLSAAG